MTSKLFIYSLTIGYTFTFATVLFFAYLIYTFSAKKVEHVNSGNYSLLAQLRVQQNFKQLIESRENRIEAMHTYDELMHAAAEYERT